VPGLALLALAPAAMPLRFLGMPGSSLAATLTGWLAFSAAAPLLFAGIARAMAAAHERPAARSLGALASGLAFGQAGMLAQTAWVASAHLPGMPPWAVSSWLGLQAATCWFLGRALLAPAGG
jgi:hypothetical protein